MWVEGKQGEEAAGGAPLSVRLWGGSPGRKCSFQPWNEMDSFPSLLAKGATLLPRVKIYILNSSTEQVRKFAKHSGFLGNEIFFFFFPTNIPLGLKDSVVGYYTKVCFVTLYSEFLGQFSFSVYQHHWLKDQACKARTISAKQIVVMAASAVGIWMSVILIWPSGSFQITLGPSAPHMQLTWMGQLCQLG